MSKTPFRFGKFYTIIRNFLLASWCWEVGMKVSNLSIAGLLVLLFVAVSPVFAQSDRGGITGRGTDQASAVVAEAKVTALNVETGETREARTNGEGN